MQCPTCDATLPDDARFCSACGSNLVAPAAGAQPAAPAPAPAPAANAPAPAAPVPAPVPATPGPGAQAPQPKRNVGLIIGIVVGVVVLLLFCCIITAIAIPAFVAYRDAKSRSTTQSTTDSSATGSQSGQITTEPEKTNPEPPASEMNPEPQALSEATAKQFVLDYLGKANAGQSAEAKSMVSSKYTSRITSDYYDLAAKDLQQFAVVKVETGEGGFVVFVKETWTSGVWTNWYLVVDKDGKLVIDDYGTE